MKGLILKDFYMMGKYCRNYILVAIIFIAVSFAGDDNMFFTFYPCLLCGMIPATLLGYDERSRWLQYSGALPYTKAQIVSSKYLIGLMVQIVNIVVIAVSQAIIMNMNGTFRADEYIMIVLIVMIMSVIASSISLPFMFKSGVEKGRIAYYVMIGIVCAGAVLVSKLFSDYAQIDIPLEIILPVLCLAGIGIHVFSWYMSIVFFNKREI